MQTKERRIHMDNIRKDWELFTTIAEEQNITKAAHKLFLSQPALSYKLNQIEKQFDEPLFIRTTKGVILTETGELYYNYAKEMIRFNQEFHDKLDNKKSTISGTLHLGASSIFADYELPSILEGFTKHYPNVKLALETGLSPRIAHLYSNNEIHVGIIRGNHQPAGEKIHIYDDPICLVTSKYCDRTHLEQVPQIRYNTDASLYSIADDWWNENYSIPPNQSIKIDTMATTRRFIQKNLGWSILPLTGLASYAKDLYIEKLYWKNGQPIVRETNLYVSPHGLERKAVKAFVEYIKEYITNRNAQI